MHSICDDVHYSPDPHFPFLLSLGMNRLIPVQLLHSTTLLAHRLDCLLTKGPKLPDNGQLNRRGLLSAYEHRRGLELHHTVGVVTGPHSDGCL